MGCGWKPRYETTRMKKGQVLGSRGEPCHVFAQKVKAWVGNDSLFEQVRRCAVARRLNQDVLIGFLKDDLEARSLWEYLTLSPFIQNDNRFHPAFHTLMVKAIWHDSPRDYRALHGNLANVYDGLVNEILPHADPHQAILDAKSSAWWVNYLEWYYHRLSHAPDGCLPQGLDLLAFLLDKSNENDVARDRVYELAQVLRDISRECPDVIYLRTWADKAVRIAEFYEKIPVSDPAYPKDFWEAVQAHESVSTQSRLTALDWLIAIAENEKDAKAISDWQQKRSQIAPLNSPQLLNPEGGEVEYAP